MRLQEEDEERTFVQRPVGNTGFQPLGKYEVSRHVALVLRKTASAWTAQLVLHG